MSGTSKIVSTIICCVVLFMGSTGFAGILETHSDALFGGGPDSGYWRGTVHFDNGNDLNGDVDFAVFTQDDFLANFSGDGYVPSVLPNGALVYTYQVFNTGSDALSAEIVGIANPANTIGSFDIGGIAPATAGFVGSNARWTFNPSLAGGENSWGLAFSSPNLPMDGAGLAIDGGGSVVQVGLPTPSSTAIPEPASLLLWSLAGCALVWLRRRAA